MWQKLKNIFFITSPIDKGKVGHLFNLQSKIYKIFSSWFSKSTKQNDSDTFQDVNPMKSQIINTLPKAERKSSRASIDTRNSFRISPTKSSDSHLSSKDLEDLRVSSMNGNDSTAKAQDSQANKATGKDKRFIFPNPRNSTYSRKK